MHLVITALTVPKAGVAERGGAKADEIKFKASGESGTCGNLAQEVSR